MTKLVVDSWVAIKWFVVEPNSTEARRILGDYQAGIVQFYAPDLINAEFGNIVWKKRTFQGLADVDAQAIVNGFRKLSITLTSTADLLDDAYRIATTHNRTVYDSLYIALSLNEKCQFVTADERLFNAVRNSYPDIILLANWP